MSTQAPEVPTGYAPRGKDNGIVKSKGTVNLPRVEGHEPVQHRARKPEWLKVRAPGGANYLRLKQLMRSQGLHTVCATSAAIETTTKAICETPGRAATG